MRIDRVKFVAELRRLDLTQTELAKRSGVSRATINGIVAGRKCSASSAQKIAAALQMNVDDLLV